MPESAQSHSDHELEVQSTDQANYPYIKMRGNLYWDGSAWTKWEGVVTLPSTTSTAINDGTTTTDKAKVADGRSSYGKGLYVLPGNYFASRTALTDGQQDFLKLNSDGNLVADVSTVGGQAVASGTAMNASTAPVLPIGVRNSAGNLFYVPGASDNADNLAVSANGNLPRVLAENVVFDGTAWDRMPGNSTDGTLVNLGTNNDVTITSGSVTATLSATDNAVLDDIAAKVADNLDGTSTHGTRDLVSANTWYAVPSTVPTAAYILIAQPRTGNAGTVRWSFLNSGTPGAGTGLEIQGNLILRLAANESVVFASSTAGDDVDWVVKEIV